MLLAEIEVKNETEESRIVAVLSDNSSMNSFHGLCLLFIYSAIRFCVFQAQ